METSRKPTARLNDLRADRDWEILRLDEPWQVQYWATRLQVPVDALTAAVHVVGTRVGDIQAHFGFRGRSSRQMPKKRRG